MPISYEDLIEPIFDGRLVAFAPFTDAHGDTRVAMAVGKGPADKREGVIQEYQAILAIHEVREFYGL